MFHFGPALALIVRVEPVAARLATQVANDPQPVAVDAQSRELGCPQTQTALSHGQPAYTAALRARSGGDALAFVLNRVVALAAFKHGSLRWWVGGSVVAFSEEDLHRHI